MGRFLEIQALREGLGHAKKGTSRAFLLTAQGGMGKTRLLRWLEQEARRQGFQVLWGNGLKEAVAPFFVFEQIFAGRRVAAAESPVKSAWSERGASAAPFQLLEEERPRRLRQLVASVPADHPLLVVSRDSPAALRERGGGLPSGTSTLWITRMEGEGRLSPGNLDGLGESASRHFHARSGSVVALDGLEYLCSQSSFPPVLRLMQFLRDIAQETDGHLLVSVNPAAFEKREISLLEADAEVERPSPPPPSDGGPLAAGAETATATLLRYLRQIEAMATGAPQLVVVDDLHWADPQSGVAFQFLARNVRGLPVLLVGAAREEEISHEPDDQGVSTFDRLRGLEDAGSLTRLALTPFDLAEGRTLAGEVLGLPLRTSGSDGEELKELLRRTGGNPYFLQESLLELREHGWLRLQGGTYEFHRAPGTRDLSSEVPTSLRRLVLQRLAVLDKEERALLDVAAVTGSEFTLPPVANVLGISVDDLQPRVRDLEARRRLVEAVSADQQAWSFSHPLVWEVAITEISPAARRRHAIALLGWWEEHRPEDMGALARLAHEAGDPVRGLPWIRQALDTALLSSAPEAASTYLGWLQELRRRREAPTEPGPLLEELHEARRLARLGGSRYARRFVEEVLGEKLPVELRWEASYSLAVVVAPSDGAEAREVLGRLQQELAAASTPVPPRLRHAVDSLAAELMIQEGKSAEALQLDQRILAAPEKEMDPEVRTRSMVTAIWCHSSLGERDLAESLLARGKQQSRDQPAALAQFLHIEVVMAVAHGGDYERAIGAAHAAAEIYRHTGQLLQSGINDFNAAEILVEHGRTDEAEVLARSLLDLGRKFDLARIRCSGNFILAQVGEKRKQWKEALALAEEAMRDAQLLKRLDDLWDCRTLTAHLQGESGDLSSAIEGYESLDREGVLRQLPRAVEVLPELSDYLYRTGRKEKAQETGARALEAAQRLGNKEAEEKVRRAMASRP